MCLHKAQCMAVVHKGLLYLGAKEQFDPRCLHLVIYVGTLVSLSQRLDPIVEVVAKKVHPLTPAVVTVVMQLTMVSHNKVLMVIPVMAVRIKVVKLLVLGSVQEQLMVPTKVAEIVAIDI